MDDNLNIEIKVNSKRALVVTLMVFILSAFGFFGLGWREPILLLIMALLLLSLPFIGLNILDKRPRIVLNDEGIYVRALHIGIIRWIDIKRAFLYAYNRQVCVCLELYNEKEYFARQSAYHRVVRPLLVLAWKAKVVIDTSGMDMSSKELFQIILSQCEKHRAAERERIKENGERMQR